VKTLPFVISLAAIACHLVPEANAQLEIVRTAGQDSPAYQLKAVGNPEVLGVIWDSADETSDYEFYIGGGMEPEFLWSPQGDHLAVNGGERRAPEVFLYRVSDQNIIPLTLDLGAEMQGPPFSDLPDNWAAAGATALRWLDDATLLVQIWADARVQAEDEEQQQARLWVQIDVGPTIIRRSETAPNDLTLIGTHQTLRGPEAVEGRVQISEQGSVLLFKWSNGEAGAGLRHGDMIGVLRNNGVALYEMVKESNGMSVIGYLADHGGGEPVSETIFIGEGSIESVAFDLPDLNGRYSAFRETTDGRLEYHLEIKGETKLKRIERSIMEEELPGIGLQLGETIATADPSGLGIYTLGLDEEEEPVLKGLRLESSSNEPIEEIMVPSYD